LIDTSKARKISANCSSVAVVMVGRRSGNGVEHRHDFVGMMSGGPFRLEGFGCVGDGCLAGAQIDYAFGGERDDWMGRVLVLL
jgi:hypothetical protein